jgi:hypothetical protein
MEITREEINKEGKTKETAEVPVFVHVCPRHFHYSSLRTYRKRFKKVDINNFLLEPHLIELSATPRHLRKLQR